MKRIEMLASLFSLGCSLLAQNTWVVDWDRRAGSHYSDLPAAIAAAAPGDRLLVVYSDQALYTAPLVDKPLDILALDAAGRPRPLTLRGLLQIRRIPAGQQVRVRGFEIGPSLVTPWGIDIRDCDGLVHLDGIYEFPFGIYNARDEFRNCRNLRLHACDLTAKGTPILFESCTVSATSCTFMAVEADGGPISFPRSADAIRLVDSTLTMSESLVVGADETPRDYRTYALDLLRSVVNVGPTCGLYGGRPVNVGQRQFARGQGTVYHDPRAVFWTTEFMDPRIVMLPEWRHDTLCEQVQRNRSFDAAMIGPPNGFGILAMSFPLPNAQPSWLGDLWIDPAQISWIGAGALDQDGRAVRTLFCHAEVPLDPYYAFQSGWLAPDGTFGVGRPVVFAVGWEPGRFWP